MKNHYSALQNFSHKISAWTPVFALAASFILLAGASKVQAQTVEKLNTTTMNGGATDWSAAPATSSIGDFGGTTEGATVTAGDLAAMTLGGNLTLGGLKTDADTPGPVTIASGSTLTLGSSGTDFNITENTTAGGGAGNLTVNCTLAVGNGGAIWTVNSGATLTVASVPTISGTTTFNGNGTAGAPGIININNWNTGNVNGGLIISGAVTVTDSGAFTLQKSSSTTTTVPTPASPVSAPATTGLALTASGASLSCTTLGLATDNSGGDMLIDTGASVTASGETTLCKNASNRAMYAEVNGGTFTCSDTVNGLLVAPNSGTTADIAEFWVSSGTANLGKITYGSSTDTAGGTGFIQVGSSTTSGNMYIGSGGVVKGSTIGSYNLTFSLYAGLLGANASWTDSASVPVALNGTTSTAFTIQTANASLTPFNITLNGVVSGPSTAPLAITSGTSPTPTLGVLKLVGANTYLGTTELNGGFANAGVAEIAGTSGPFGKEAASAAGSITFGGGTLQYSSVNQNDYSGRFSTAGSQPISIDLNGQTVTFATALTGTGTSLTLMNSGSGGSLTLSAAESYTGNTTINSGVLNVDNTSSGTGAIQVNSGGTLSGTGTLGGVATIASGGVVAPGSAGAGTLSVAGLTIGSGSLVNITPGGSEVAVTTSGGLTINGGSFNLYQAGGTVTFSTPSTYNLMTFSGGISGTGLDSTWTTASSSNPHIGNPAPFTTYQFGTDITGTILQLTIVSTINIDTWTAGTTGNWSVAGNWLANTGSAPPQNPGDQATFDNGGATSLATVTLDANEKVGEIAINNANSFVIANAGNTLTLDNGGGGALVHVTAGTANAIQTAVALNDNATITTGVGDTLAVSGTVTNTLTPPFTPKLTVNGAGKTVLSVANGYGPASSGTVGTVLSGGGILNAGAATSLGAGDLSIAGSSTLQATGLSLANNILIGTGVAATVDNEGGALALNGTISGATGSLNSISAGTLTLGGANTYGGGTAISAGVVSISADGASGGSAGNLGAVPASATPNNILINGGDLNINGGASAVTVHANRGIGIGPTTVASAGTYTASIDNSGSATAAIGGIIASAGNSGTQNLAIDSLGGTGVVALNGANTFNGTTTIGASGTLELNNSLALQDSILNYNTGTLIFGSTVTAATIDQFEGSQSLVLNNQNSTPAGVTLTTGGNGASWSYAGALSGAGGLTKAGSGTLTLSGANTYTGTTTGSGGTLTITTGGSISSTAGAITGLGFNIAGGSVTTTGPTTLQEVNNAFQESSGSFSGGSVAYAGTSADGMLISLSGGTFTATSMDLGRTFDQGTTPSIAAPDAAQTTSGLYVNGATAQINGPLSFGDQGSSGSVLVASGSLTVTGEVEVGSDTSGGRWSVLQVSGGSFTSSDTVNGIVIGAGASGNPSDSEVLLSGGVTSANLINFGTSGNSAYFAYLFVTNATLNVGGGGLQELSTPSTQADALFGLGSSTLASTAAWVNPTPGALAIQLGGASTIDAAFNMTIGGPLTDGGNTGALLVTGAGRLTLLGTNTYTGGTGVSASGALVIGGSGSLATRNYLANITNNGIFIYSSSANQTFQGAISGTGQFNMIGTGTMTLQGINSYTGNTTISNGTLQLNQVGVLGGGNYAGNITNYGTLIFGSSAAQTFSGVISGTGSISQVGGEFLTLSGANTYSGATTLTSAPGLILGVGGSIANSSVSIASGSQFDVSAVSTAGAPYNMGGTSFTASGDGAATLIIASGGFATNAIPTILNLTSATAGAVPNPALTVTGGTMVLSNNQFTINGPVLPPGIYTLINSNAGGGILDNSQPANTYPTPTGTALTWPNTTASISVQGGDAVVLTVSSTDNCGGGPPAPSYQVLDPTDVILTFSDTNGLSSVVGWNMINCTFVGGQATIYGGQIVGLGTVGANSGTATEGTPYVLPLGTTNLVLEVTETTQNESLGARVNAQVTDGCGNSISFDPISATLYLSQSGEVRTVFNNLSQNDKYVSLKNGTPGLRSARIIVNGTVFALNGLANGANEVVDIASALVGGTGNTVVVEGFGTKGAGALVSIGEAPASPNSGDIAVSSLSAPASTFINLPSLQITPVGGQTVLSWPTTGPAGEDFTAYQLQSSSTGSPGSWSVVGTAPVNSGGQLTVTVAAGGSAQFYQLADPAAQ